MRVQRKSIECIAGGATTTASLLVEYDIHRTVRLRIELSDRRCHGRELIEPARWTMCQAPDARIRCDRDVTLHELATGRAYIEVLATDQDLVIAKLSRRKTVSALHCGFFPTTDSSRRNPDSTFVFGPMYRLLESYENIGLAIMAEGRS